MVHITEELRLFLKDFSEIVPGLGPVGVSVLFDNIDSFNDLFKLNKNELEKLKSSKGRRIFNEKTIGGFLRLIKFLEPSEGLTSNWIRLSTLRFIDQNIKAVEGKREIKDLKIDPFIVREFNLSPDEIVRFFLYQTVTKSVVTSMGTQFEKLAKISYLKITQQPGFDGELVKNSKKYFFQVKSGPDVLNKDMLERLGQHMDKAKKEEPGCEALLGLCYGRTDQISGKIKRYLPGEGLENVKIGEEFWDFITGEKGYYKKMLNAIYQASMLYPHFRKALDEIPEQTLRDTSKEQQKLTEVTNVDKNKATEGSIVEIIEGKIEDLIKDWRNKYGSLEDKTVNQMIEDHM